MQSMLSAQMSIFPIVMHLSSEEYYYLIYFKTSLYILKPYLVKKYLKIHRDLKLFSITF